MTTIDAIYLVVWTAFAAASWRNPRGLVWLTALLAGYFASGLYWRAGGTQGELVAGLCDAAMCALLFWFGRRRWELWLWLLSQISLLVNIIYLTSNLTGAHVIDHEVYSIALEALNAIAFVLIGGVSAFKAAGKTDGIAFNPWVSVLGFARPADFSTESGAKRK